MKSKFIFIFLAAMLLLPELLVAQKQAQHDTKTSAMQGGMSMMRANMGIMGDITTKMYQLMGGGQLNPEQQKQILNMMREMSQMMQEMSVPHGEQVKKRHNKELREMHQRLNTLQGHDGP